MQSVLDDHNFPFVPLKPVPQMQWVDDKGPDATGRTYGQWWFNCPMLKDGRCSIYLNRPQLCKDYQPYSDGLCVMFRPKVELPVSPDPKV